jgi:ethanolamine utilization protein EutM
MAKREQKANDGNHTGQALGIIETRGMTGAIEACDAMTKSAFVRVTNTYKVDAGIVTVLVRGDIGAVQAATEAGAEAARKVGELRGSHVIARPHQGIEEKFS